MKRVAIIGGGMGGLSAAYGLVRDNSARDLEITVFQMGWRLGGKCATGRGPHGRIEEHGIHGFLGAYYNTLVMMQDVYSNWTPNPGCPIPRYEDAFVKLNTGLHWERDGGVLKRWPKWTPENALTLDMIRAAPNLLVMWLKVYAEVLRKRLEAVPSGGSGATLAGVFEHAFAIEPLDDLVKSAAAFEKVDMSAPLAAADTTLVDFWDAINRFIDRPVRHSTNNSDAIRRNLLEVEMFQVILRGIRDDSIMEAGFGAIDHENYADWLRRHGASVNLLESPLVAYIVNLTFQFPNGDISLEPKMSAASYLQWALRSGTYVEKSLYLFTAGTGETIITPLYSYLKAKGVKFRFFRELVDIETNATGDAVTQLSFREQAVVKGDRQYDPLVAIKGLECWPNRPLFDQLEPHKDIEAADFEKPGAAAFGGLEDYAVANEEDADFSTVILAIPPRAIVAGATGLLERNAHWGERIGKMATTATQAMQLWFKEPIEALASMPSQVTTGGMEKFYYGSANFPGEMHGELDFSKYLKFEDWGSDGPKGLLYGCGVMVDPPTPNGMTERAAADLRAFETSRSMLTLMGADLLPLSVDQSCETVNTHALDFSDLYVDPALAPGDSVGQNRLAAQYFRGNVFPSDRYTQSPPSTKEHRVNPLKPGLSNLTGAGDWVDTVLNVGSVECTVMGGLLAAAFAGDPKAASKVIGAWATPADSLLVN